MSLSDRVSGPTQGRVFDGFKVVVVASFWAFSGCYRPARYKFRAGKPVSH